MEASGIGEVIAGNYHLADVIAVGGSGTVYRALRVGSPERAAAERESFGDAVALKLMHAEHPEGDAERMRFSREAAVLQKLEHPNVVRVLDYGHSDGGVPFLVFPLLKGRTLEERIAADGALDWNETGRLALQVLAALDRAHALGIVHRDIKPANIFLTPSMLGEQVQLLDFGLARAVRGGLEVEVTRTGALVGTPRYMAPEQVRGEQVGETADIYSFGLVLAEMLTAKPVCTADRELEIYMTHGSDRALDLPVEVLRSPFATVIRRAVAKPLEVRYRLASQMLAVGGYHVCVVLNDGTARCWGGNSDGQLGANGAFMSATPVMVENLLGVVDAMAAGGSHSCSTVDGTTLWCWGDNGYGQLGNGSSEDSVTPVRVDL